MVKIEVTGCDIDHAIPALTYRIAVSDGRLVELDLCEVHAEPIERVVGSVPEVADEGPEGADPPAGPSPTRSQVEASSPPPPAAKKVVAKRVTAKKATAKKAPRRRTPMVTSLEEIEARKRR